MSASSRESSESSRGSRGSRCSRDRAIYDDLPEPISARWIYPDSEEPIPNRFEINVEPRYLERIYHHNLDGIHDQPVFGQQREYSDIETVFSAPLNDGVYDGITTFQRRRPIYRSPVSPNERITGHKRMLKLSNLPSDWIEFLFHNLYSKNKKTVRNFIKRNVVSAPYTAAFTPELDRELREELLKRFKEIPHVRSHDEIEIGFNDGWYDHIDDHRFIGDDESDDFINDYENLFLDTDAIKFDRKHRITYNKKNQKIKPANKSDTMRFLIKHNRVPLDLSPSKNPYSKSNQRRRTQRLQAKKLMKKQQLIDAEDAENAPIYDGGANKSRQNKRGQYKIAHNKTRQNRK